LYQHGRAQAILPGWLGCFSSSDKAPLSEDKEGNARGAPAADPRARSVSAMMPEDSRKYKVIPFGKMLLHRAGGSQTAV
jgi:hypothetical protein